MNPSTKLSVCLYSDANFLAIGLAENLLSKNCTVKVLTDDVKTWRLKTFQISSTSKFQIIDIKNFNNSERFDYSIFCGGYINTNKAYSDYQSFSRVINSISSKTLVIFPFEVYDKNKVESFNVTDNSAFLFTGDLIGPRINFESNLLMSKILYQAVWEKKINLAVGEVFYPMFIADAIRVIVKWLFSFGPYGKKILFLGNQVSGDVLWGYLRKQYGNIEISYNNTVPPRNVPRNIEVETINNNLQLSLNETYSWILSNPHSTSQKIKTTTQTKRVKNPIKIPKKVKKAISVLLVILFFPLITMLLSFTATFISYKSLATGNYNLAQNSILIAQTLAVVSEKESLVLGKIPAIGIIYKEIEFGSSVVGKADGMVGHLIPVTVNAANLFGKILGKEIYDSKELSTKIESQITLLSEDASNIKVLTDNSAKAGVLLAKLMLSKIDLNRFVKLVSETRVLTNNIPNLLGQGQSKTYLILFQNNMELRPTGGFIGSFGLMTFDGGRLSDLTVNDVYSADGQLNGHIEPPAPIKTYLGEANWWLRDSNWDPDFPTSAKRAEWFLEKELGKKVDGVVATDLYPIKEMLKVTGEIFLTDYNLSINSNNLYEKTQSEVEDNFFPGTYKKASFLTALSRTILGDLGGLTSNQKIGIFKVLYTSLSDRHLQLYLHDNVSQGSVAALQWDGAVISPSCGDNCYADLIGLVESNVGVNKANYFIERNIKLDVNTGPYQINRRLTLGIKNLANSALGPSGRYFPYVRLLIPSDVYQVTVKSINGGSVENLTPDIVEVRGHKEVGVPIEILGGGNKSLEFTWSTTVDKKSSIQSYGLYVRKQAGTENDPISLNVVGNQVQIVPDPRFSLTRSGVYAYNTTLARDLFSLFTW